MASLQQNGAMKTTPDRLVPIRTVCATYNLNPNTLRTWERRYGIICPERSEGGHRGYGKEDLATIEQMLRLMGEGLSPSEAANKVRSAAQVAPLAPSTDELQLHRDRFRAAVRAMDHAAALDAVHQAGAIVGYKECVEGVLFPELAYWGEQWEQSHHGIASEHVATLTVQSFLMEQQRQALSSASGSSVTLACAPGELHQLPILHVSHLLALSGILKPLILVSGLPIREIMDISRQHNAAAVVISATIAPRPDVVREWISDLVDSGWEERTILVGGGFTRSRIFSETRVRSAPGGYGQVLRVLRRILGK